MKKTTLEVEKKLLPRLRLISVVLIFFSAFTCTYAFVVDPYLSTVNLDDDRLYVHEEIAGFPESEKTPAFFVTPLERINLFLAALVFGAVGASCLVVYLKKKKKYGA